MTAEYRIGVFDSGVGGFSVVRPLLIRFPELSFIYVADTAHVPYSGKTPEELEDLVGRILQFFVEQKVNLVVFACNTSSAWVLPRVRSLFPVPVYGVVEPGVRAALEATKGKGIGVVANEVTARSGIFARLIHEKNPQIPVIEQPCPLLVPLVESGDIDSPAAEELVAGYCKPLRGKIDTLLHACTHFPYLEHQFRKALPKVKQIDPANDLTDELLPILSEGIKKESSLSSLMPNEIQAVREMDSAILKPHQSQSAPERKLFATKVTPQVSAWAKKVLDWDTAAMPLSLDSVTPWMRRAPR